MSDASFERDPVEALAEEFMERKRCGETPTIEEYAEQHPDLAEDIRDLFPALVLMEDNKPLADSASGSASSTDSPSPPQLTELGDYRIIREVGRGGMGVVYEAEQVSLGRHVAVKVLPRNLLTDNKQKRRFEREARAAARLHHTNIVPVFGVGEHDGMNYYVMQFIQGLGLDEVFDELKRLQQSSTSGAPPEGVELRISQRSDVSAAAVARSLMTGGLHQTMITAEVDSDEVGGGDPAATLDLRRSRAANRSANASQLTGNTSSSRLSDTLNQSGAISLPGQATSEVISKSRLRKLTYWQSVATMGVQVASALKYAHDQGIQHRDIKPSNLLLDLRGTVWVTDFGLAKTDDQQNITHTGDILGTLRYMPPEAFQGVTDKRGDIYSLGLTLYELLAMQPAYDEGDKHRLIHQVTHEAPPRLDKLNPDIPRDLVTIIHKAIERDADHRYEDAGELAEDLQRFIDDEPIHARRISLMERFSRWSRRNKGLAVALSAIASLVLVGFVGSVIAAGYFRRLQRETADERDKADIARQQAIADRRVAIGAKERASQLASKEKEARKRSERAELETLKALNTASRSAGEANLAKLQSLWTAAESDRQSKAFDLLKESAMLRRAAVRLSARLAPEEGKATREFWRRLIPRYRDQAYRWLTQTSLQPLQNHSLDSMYSSRTSSFAPREFTLSPDLRRLARLKFDRETRTRSIQVIDPVAGNITATSEMTRSRGPIALGFSSDSQSLLVASLGPALLGKRVFYIEYRSANDLKLTRATTLPADGVYYGPGKYRWFNRQGTRFVHGSAGTAVWDLNGRLLFSDAELYPVDITDSDHLVGIRNKSTVQVVDLKDGKVIREFRLPCEAPAYTSGISGSGSTAVSSSPEGKWLVVELRRRLSRDERVRPLAVFDLNTGKQVAEIRLPLSPTPYSYFVSAAFHPTRPILAVEDERSVTLVTIPDGSVLSKTPIPNAAPEPRLRTTPFHVGFNQRGTRLVTGLSVYRTDGGRSTKIQLQYWDASIARELSRQVEYPGSIRDVRLTPAGPVIVTGASGSTIHGPTFNTGTSWKEPGTQSSPAGGFEPSEKHFIRALTDRFEVFDAATGRLQTSVPRAWSKDSSPVSLPAHESYRWVVGVDRAGEAPRLRLFDTTQLKWTNHLLDSGHTPTQVEFDHEGKYLYLDFTASGKKFATVVRLSDGKKLLQVPGPLNDSDKSITAGHLLIKTRESGFVIRAYDLETGRVTAEYRSKTDFSFYSSNIGGAGDQAILLQKQGSRYQLLAWPFTTGKPVKPLPRTYDGVDWVRIHSGRMLVKVRLAPQTSSKTAFDGRWKDRYGYEAQIRQQGDRIQATMLSSRRRSYWTSGSGVISGKTNANLKVRLGTSPVATWKGTLENAHVIRWSDTDTWTRAPRSVVQLWDLSTEKLLNSLDVPSTYFSTYEFEKYGKVLIVEPEGVVWDLKDGKMRGGLPSSLHRIDPHGRFVAFWTGDVFDMSTMKLLPLPSDLRGESHVFTPDGHYAVILPGTYESRPNDWAKVVDLETGKVKWKPAESFSGGSATISPDGRWIGFVDPKSADRLHVYATATGKKLQTIITRRGNFRTDQPLSGELPKIWLSASGKYVAVAYLDQVTLGRTDRPRVHATLPMVGQHGSMNAISVSPDGRVIAVGSSTGTVVFRDAKDGRVLGVLDDRGTGSADIQRVIFNPKRNQIATRKADGEICYWEWSRTNENNGTVAARLLWSDATFPGTFLAISPDGTLLAAADKRGTVQLFESETGKPSRRLNPLGADRTPGAITFSPDGRILAVARGRLVALWDVDAGVLNRAWNAKQGKIQDLVIDPHGRFLVTTGRDVRVWDFATGQLLLTFGRQASPIRRAGFDASGRRLTVVLNGRTLATTNLIDQLKALDELGFNASTLRTNVAWNQPLWEPFPQRLLVAEWLLREFLPRLQEAERNRDWKQAVALLNRILADYPMNEVGDGIGVDLRWSGRVFTITNIVPGGAADKQGGLQPGARIVAIGQGDRGRLFGVSGKHVRDVNRMIRGEAGTKLTLIIQKGRGGFPYVITREACKAEISPIRLWLLERRMNAYAELKDWPAATRDLAALLDRMPERLPVILDFHQPRTELLYTTYHRRPDLFAALEAARPNDIHLAIVRGLAQAMDGDWKPAQKAFASVIRRTSAGEHWYLYAALCLLAGETEAYDQHLAWMAKQPGEPADETNAYIFSRCAGLADSRLPRSQMLQWAKQSAQTENTAWVWHAAALASYRAGKYDDAMEKVQTAIGSSWGAHTLNDILLGMVLCQQGDYVTARTQLEKVDEQRKLYLPDQIEFHVLVPELKRLVDGEDTFRARRTAALKHQKEGRLTEAAAALRKEFATWKSPSKTPAEARRAAIAACDLGLVLVEQGRLKEAQELLATGLQGINRFGRPQWFAPERVVAAAGHVLKEQPKNPVALKAAALALKADGNLNVARRHLETLHELAPDDAGYAGELGDVIIRLNSPAWSVMKPVKGTSQRGAKVELQEDGSIFVDGKGVSYDTYVLRFRSNLKSIQSLRLEAIPDPRLPGGGAGWGGVDGGFHITEFRVHTASDDPQEPAKWLTIDAAIANPADATNSIEHIFDENPQTGWVGGPRANELAWADFKLSNPSTDTTREIVITIGNGSRQRYHNLGRFRLLAAAQSTVGIQQAIAKQELSGFATLATAYALEGKTKLALLAFVKALEQTKDASSRAAIVKHARDKTILSALLRMWPKDAAVRVVMARHYVQSSKLQEARAQFEAALALDSKQIDAASGLANLILNRNSSSWTVLKPVEMKSDGGATLTRLRDGSILAGGVNPRPGDRYTIRVKPGVARICALKLETIPDPSLPKGGSGRDSNGSFFLHELRLGVAKANEGSPVRPIAVRDALASHTREGSLASNAVDGNLRTWWDPWPRIHEPLEIVFFPAQAVETADGVLVIELESKSTWPNSALGRFRLSVLSNPEKLSIERRTLAARQLTDPWERLAAMYHIVGDQPALEKLARNNPSTWLTLARLDSVVGDRQQALAHYAAYLRASGGLTRAMVFDGRTNHVTSKHVPFDTYKAFTVEAWVLDWKGYVFQQGINGDPESSIYFMFGGPWMRNMSGWESGSTGRNFDVELPHDRKSGWRHLAMTFDGRIRRFFVDGRLVNEAYVPKPGPLQESRLLNLAVRGNDREAGPYGKGLMASFRISKSARYTTGFKPSETLKSDPDTVLLYDLSDANEERLVDKSGNERHGTIHGPRWIVHATPRPKKPDKGDGGGTAGKQKM